MTVWAVIYGDDWQSGHWVYGVYTTLKQATEALQDIKDKFYTGGCFIQEYQLDTIWNDYSARL